MTMRATLEPEVVPRMSGMHWSSVILRSVGPVAILV